MQTKYAYSEENIILVDSIENVSIKHKLLLEILMFSDIFVHAFCSLEMNRIMNRAIRPVLHETSKSHKLKTELNANNPAYSHTNEPHSSDYCQTRPSYTVILAIGVFDSATRPMTFKFNGHPEIKVHKVHPLIRVL